MSIETSVALNVTFLEELKKFFREHPEAIDMHEPIRPTSSTVPLLLEVFRQFKTEKDLLNCGTVGCIAGWTCALKDPELFKSSEWEWLYTSDDYWNEIETHAARILGIIAEEDKLKDNEAVALFHVHLWPESLRNLYYFGVESKPYENVNSKRPSVKERRVMAMCKAIDYYIAHQEGLLRDSYIA